VDLRPARPTDAAGIRAIYGPIVAETAISFELDVPSVDEMARRITDLQNGYPWLVAEEGGEVAGYAYGSAHRTRAAYGWSTDVSVYVHPRAHRRGVGRALYAALLDLLRCQRYEQAFAGIALPNPASVGLHEAMGFTPVGIYRDVGWKLGRWHDVGWWQRRLRPADRDPAAAATTSPPAVPRPFGDLSGPEIDGALALGTLRLRLH
jgi:L-amino acid N-acyltransferase YncA